MKPVLSTLLAALLGIQALLGCCRHHVCAQSIAPHATHFHACADDCDCCPGDDEESTPCNCQVECHGVCKFLPSQKVQLDNPLSNAAFDVVAVQPVAFNVESPTLSVSEHSRGSGPPAAPLRLHLLLEHLLV